MMREWASRHPAAAAELLELLGEPARSAGRLGDDEAGAQAALRIAASVSGMRLWRNNVGSLQDASGRWVRFGLANDSRTVNSALKSGDLIGINPVVITPAMVGATIGQFVSYEVKRPGWVYSGTEREEAQARWCALVNMMGGYARFSTGGL